MQGSRIHLRHLFPALCFVALLSAAAYSQSSSERVMPPEFRSDGCSLFPDGNYGACCVEHDKAYFFGGSLKERREADKKLYECVKATTGRCNKLTARIMWFGVRIGGVSFLPTPFRWGFGNKFPRKEPAKEKADQIPKPNGH